MHRLLALLPAANPAPTPLPTPAPVTDPFEPIRAAAPPILTEIARIASDNLTVVVLGVVAILLFIAASLAPSAIASLEARRPTAPVRTGGKRGPLLERMGRQLRLLLRPQNGLRETVAEMLFRDGEDSGPIITEGDFFLFLQLVAGVSITLFGLLIYTVLLPFPPVIAAGVAGYFLPMWWANQRNTARRALIIAELPAALTAIERRVASQIPFTEAVRSAGESGEGPIYAEIAWAGRQMAASSADEYEVLREIDRRNGTTIFLSVAAQLERAVKVNRQTFVKTFLAFCDRVRDEQDKDLEEGAEKVPGQVVAAMTPFLVVAILLAAFGPIVINLINNGSIG
jgi:Flp pilus assembly protein TadB